MIPELRNELLFFCSRDELERLQPLSQALFGMIVAGSNVLPLRPIHHVHMDREASDGKIKIFDKTDWRANEWKPDYEASTHDGDFAETFRRLQHTCIKFFRVWFRDSPFLRYWKAQETAAFAVVDIDYGRPEPTDYDVLDSIMNHLRPRTTMSFCNKQSSWHLELLTRASFLNNLQTCSVCVYGDAFLPPSFILEEPGYSNYDLLCGDNCQLADGIDGLIESFVRDGCTNRKLESVLIMWHDRAHPRAPKQLSSPTKIDVPLPKTNLSAYITSLVHQVTQCEVHSFVNKKQWKRMDVYKWRVVEDHYDGHRRTTHILQFLVKNL
ncbi:hypothetical protein AAVH_33059 [Aphelenchoides avenae]|nr:hypothetical protein AAVH_33059 [Aphelenchus avenae]